MNVTTEYDNLIKEATEDWLPQWEWLWFKSQFYAESLLQADAVSPAGAKGLCQFMDDTWDDVSVRLHYPSTASPFNPIYAIPAGVYFMSLLRNGWAAKRSEDDRRKLSFASYNAGFGNILKAQKLANGATDYDSIIAKLPDVTGKKSKETIGYVKRIVEYYNEFKKQENGNAT